MELGGSLSLHVGLLGRETSVWALSDQYLGFRTWGECDEKQAIEPGGSGGALLGVTE